MSTSRTTHVPIGRKLWVASIIIRCMQAQSRGLSGLFVGSVPLERPRGTYCPYLLEQLMMFGFGDPVYSDIGGRKGHYLIPFQRV